MSDLTDTIFWARRRLRASCPEFAMVERWAWVFGLSRRAFRRLATGYANPNPQGWP